MTLHAVERKKKEKKENSSSRFECIYDIFSALQDINGPILFSFFAEAFSCLMHGRHKN